MIGDGGWTARVVHPRELTAQQIELWGAFVAKDATLDHPFFAAAFARAVGRVHPRAYVAILAKGGRTAGFLPFQFPSRAAAALGAAERIGGELADRFGIVAGDDLGLGAAELLRLARLNSIGFSFLPQEQLRHGFAAQRTVAGQHVRLPADPQEFWTALKSTSRKFVSQVERNERLLATEFGPLRMELHADPALELPRLIATKVAQYRRTVGTNPLAETWKTDLFRVLAELREPGCTGLLSTLYAGEVWLASHLGIMSSRVFHYWFPVYNVDYAKFSPGNVLTKYLVQAAVAAGARFFDMAGFGQYKDHFRPETYEYQSGFWRANGLGGLVNQVARSVSWRIANRKARQHKDRAAASG